MSNQFDVSNTGQISQDSTLIRYRVALWPSRLAAYQITEIPIRAREADHTLEVAVLALQQYGTSSMGMVVVLSAEKQETFYDLEMKDRVAHYSDRQEAPRAVGRVLPFRRFLDIFAKLSTMLILSIHMREGGI